MFDSGRNVPLVFPKWDNATLGAFSRMYEVPILPRIVLRSVSQALLLPAELPAAEAGAMRVGGVQLDLRAIRQEDISSLVPWMQEIQRNLKEHDMKLALHFPASLARLDSFAALVALFTGAMIVVDSEAQAQAL